MSEIWELTNEQIIERVNAWQNAGFVHPLTCRWSSKHPLLFPIVVNGKVVLRCPKCKMPHQDQLNIPPSILQITPQQIDEEKKKLTELGFKNGEMKKTEIRSDVFGWFDSPEQTTAVHDPGMNGLCIVCANKLEHPLKTISLMKVGDSRSFFYRCHKSCFDQTDEKQMVELESSLIDNL